MPAHLILHKGNALALDRVPQDALGYAGRVRRGQSRLNGVQVMAVDLVQIKAESLYLGGQVAQGHDLVVAAVDLQAVVVDDDRQIVQLVVSGGHKCLPNLPLLALAVTQQGKDLRVLAQLFGAQSHAHSDGAALAQGAGGGIHAGNLLAVRMSLQDAVELAEVGVFAAVNKAQAGQNRVVAGGTVALAEHKAVPPIPLGILGIQPHVVIKNAGHKLHGRQGTTGMPTAGIGRHSDDVAAHLPADFGKFSRIHEKPPIQYIAYKNMVHHLPSKVKICRA